MSAARALLDDLVGFGWSGRRPRTRTLIWLAALTVYAVWRSSGIVAAPAPFTNDGHAVASFNLAINDVFCGQRGQMSVTHTIGMRISAEPPLASKPVRAVIEETAGSVPAYCATVTDPYSNNERSLEWLEAILLRSAGSSATAETIGRALLALRLAIVLAFCGALFLAGGGVLMSAVVYEVGLALCQRTDFVGNTVYPFVWVAPLLTMILYGWLLGRAGTRTRSGDWLLLVGVGLAAALGANLRTSHLPVYIALFPLFLWFWRPATMRSAAASAVVVCAGYLAGHWVIVESRQPPVAPLRNYSYHAIAHPLVLSVAVPGNYLARTEGIEWLDDVGLKLARRVDPSVVYLGPSYQRVLFEYYLSLWQRRPRSMAALYLWKIDVAGATMAQSMSVDNRAIWASLGPWEMLRNGFVRFWAMATLLVASALAYRRRRRVVTAIVAMLSLAALLLNLEMAIIMPSFTIKYHAFTVFYAALMGIWTAQLAVNAVLWLAMLGSTALLGWEEGPRVEHARPHEGAHAD